MFGKLANAISGAVGNSQRQIANLVNMKGNKDVRECIMAGCVLVAYADGDCSNDERDTAIEAAANNRFIKECGFTAFELGQDFTNFAMKSPGSRSGRRELLKEIDDVMANPKIAPMAGDIFTILLDVADQGGISPDERNVLTMIAASMRIDLKNPQFAF